VTFEEAQKDEEKFAAWRKQTLDWIREQSAKLEALLLQYNSFDLIANLTLTQLWVNPEKHNIASHDGLPAIVEYATLLYLKHPFTVRLPHPIGQVPLEEIDKLGRSILLTTGLYYASDRRSTISGKGPEPIDSLRYRSMTHEMTVRSPGYEHHQRETLRGLFEPFQDWMLRELGFSVLDLFAMEDAIQAVTSRKVFSRLDEGREAIEKVKSDVRLVRRGKAPSSDLGEMVTELSKLSPSKAAAQIKIMLTAWVMALIGTACLSFDADEIAAETKLPIERVNSIFAFFSLEFGSVPADFFLMSPTHPLRERPLVHHAGSYLYPVPGSMVWALQRRVEAEMNPSIAKARSESKTWQKYEKRRGDYLESESMRLLGTALRTDELYRNLTYTVVEDGENKIAELDGMIQFDRTLLLVESKAGALTAPARRGGRERIKSNIQDLLGKAHKQALRARNYIENTDEPKFFAADGSEIAFDKSRFVRTILISTSLDTLDVFNTALHEVVSAGLLEEEHLPWAVSLDVLRVIAEMNEFPSQLIHYLTRRLRVNEFKKFYAADELDWFGLYLSRGLCFDKDGRFAEATQVMFDGSFSEDFDSYYFYAQGQRTKPAPKPTQPMPKLLRRIILELDERKEADGHSEAILRFLNWNDESRRQLVAGVGELRKRTRANGKIHDFTMASAEDKAGVTCFAATPSKAEEAMRRLQTYCLMKKYQIRADSWLGLLTVVDQEPIIQGFVICAGPWTQDDEIERLVATLPSSQRLS